MLTKLWKDPVWSKVISAGILAIIGAAGTYFLNWWPIIKNAGSSFFAFLGKSTQIANWLIGVMALSTLLVVIVGFILLRIALYPTKQEASWTNYKSDTFFGLVWYWKYGSEASIHGLYACCRNCHYEVYPSDISPYRVAPRIIYHCDSCGLEVGPFDGNQFQLESKVERSIHQKLRTGNWNSSKSIQQET